MRSFFVLTVIFSKLGLAGWQYLPDAKARVIIHVPESPTGCSSCLWMNPKSKLPFFRIELITQGDVKSIKILCEGEQKARSLLLKMFATPESVWRKAHSHPEQGDIYTVWIDTPYGENDLNWINPFLKSFDSTVPEIHRNWQFVID